MMGSTSAMRLVGCLVASAWAARGQLDASGRLVLPRADWVDATQGRGGGGGGGSMDLATFLAPMHEELGGRWEVPVVLLRDGAGAEVSAFHGLGNDTRSVDDFLAAVAELGLSAVLQLERLEEARGFYDEALHWTTSCPDCASAHVYVSPPGQAALANHTDSGDVAVWQLMGAKEWLTCAATFGGDELRLPASFSAKVGSCARYGDDEMRDVLADARGDADFFDCETATLSAGEGLYVPRRTLHSARATTSGFSAHVTLNNDPAGGDFTKTAAAGGSCANRLLLGGDLLGDDFEADVLGADGRRLACNDASGGDAYTACPAGWYGSWYGVYTGASNCDDSCDFWGGVPQGRKRVIQRSLHCGVLASVQRKNASFANA